MEGVDDGYSEVAETFCRGEACKGRAVDRAGVAGWFRLGVVCSGNGGVWWRRRVRRSSGRCAGMYSGGISVVHGACRLARRSRPSEVGELAGRVTRNL